MKLCKDLTAITEPETWEELLQGFRLPPTEKPTKLAFKISLICHLWFSVFIRQVPEVAGTFWFDDQDWFLSRSRSGAFLFTLNHSVGAHGLRLDQFAECFTIFRDYVKTNPIRVINHDENMMGWLIHKGGSFYYVPDNDETVG